jgi:hypothetical protein
MMRQRRWIGAGEEDSDAEDNEFGEHWGVPGVSNREFTLGGMFQESNQYSHLLLCLQLQRSSA